MFEAFLYGGAVGNALKTIWWLRETTDDVDDDVVVDDDYHHCSM